MPEKLRAFLQSLPPTFDVPTATFILKELRVVAERAGNTLPPMTRLVTDWSVHAFLDRKQAQVLVTDISNAAEEHNAEVDKFCARLNDAISFDRLRRELLALCAAFNLDATFIRSSRRWRDFADKMFDDLLQKPLQLKTPEESNVRFRFAITEVRLEFGQATKWGLPPGKQVLQWRLTIFDRKPGNTKVPLTGVALVKSPESEQDIV